MSPTITMDTARGLLPVRPEDGHKGTFGHVFIIAGSRGFTGAAKLACHAAGRSGVGLVTLGVPFPLGDIIAMELLEAMSLRLPATEAETVAQDALERALTFSQDKQAVVLGPGISRHADTTAFVHDFVPACSPPLVVDADGLNALSENVASLRERAAPTILTPHPGEMARLLGTTTAEVQADREGSARHAANDLGVTLVLKGQGTVVAAPDGRVAVNTTGNHGMGTGGTGDVLAGLLGGLLAQGVEPFDAACLGVFTHGLAGDIAAEAYTARGMVAGDLLNALPEAWMALEGDRA